MNITKTLYWLARNCFADSLDFFQQYARRAYLAAALRTRIARGTYVSSDSSIGRFSYIGRWCYVTRAQIGNFTSIANHVQIGMWEHDLEALSTSSLFYADPYAQLTQKDCTIWHDVWIGANTVVRRGVHIWDGAVIGANSFVNTDIPPFAIAVGSPARIVKYRFDETKIAQIYSSRWWDSGDLVEAKNIHNSLT